MAEVEVEVEVAMEAVAVGVIEHSILAQGSRSLFIGAP
jgi:hypothetical protein